MFSIKEKVTRLIAVCALVWGLGFFSILKLKNVQKPKDLKRELSIIVDHDAIDALSNEKAITSTLENMVAQLEGVGNLSTYTTRKTSMISFSVDENQNIKTKKAEIKQLLRRIYRTFPDNTTFPTIKQTKSSSENIFSREIAFFNDQENPNLIKRINELTRYFERTRPDLSFDLKVNPIEKYDIIVNRNQANLHNLTLEDISLSVKSILDNRYIGLMQSGETVSPFRQEIKKSPRLDDILIDNESGLPILLSDISKIVVSENNLDNIRRVNGRNVISLKVNFADDTTVEDFLVHFKKHQLAKGLEFIVLGNSGKKVVKATEMSYKHLISIILACILLYLFWYHTSLKSLILIGFISGLFIAILLLLIFSEVVSFDKLGFHFAIVISLCIHLVLLYLPPKLLAKKVLSLLGLVAALCLLSHFDQNILPSLKIIFITLVSQFLMLLAYSLIIFNSTNELSSQNSFINIPYFTFIKVVTAIGVLTLVGFPLSHINNRPQGIYVESNNFLSRFYNSYEGLLGQYLTLANASQINVNDNARIGVLAKLEYGSSLPNLNRIIKQLEDKLQSIKGVDYFETSINQSQNAVVNVKLTNGISLSSALEIKNLIVNETRNLGGVRWTVINSGSVFQNQPSDELPSFKILLEGYDYVNLGNFARNLADSFLNSPRIENKRIVNSLEEVNDFNNQQYTLRAKDNTFHYNIGEKISELYNKKIIRNFERELNILWENDSSLTELLNTQVSSSLGVNKIGDIMELEVKPTHQGIYKKSRNYTKYITYDYIGNLEAGNIFSEEIIANYQARLPYGYAVSIDKKKQMPNPNTIDIEIALLVLTSVLSISFISANSISQGWFIFIFSISVLIIPLVTIKNYENLTDGNLNLFLLLTFLIGWFLPSIQQTYKRMSKTLSIGKFSKIVCALCFLCAYISIDEGQSSAVIMLTITGLLAISLSKIVTAIFSQSTKFK